MKNRIENHQAFNFRVAEVETYCEISTDIHNIMVPNRKEKQLILGSLQ